jgi:hypothetical protein
MARSLGSTAGAGFFYSRFQVRSGRKYRLALSHVSLALCFLLLAACFKSDDTPGLLHSGQTAEEALQLAGPPTAILDPAEAPAETSCSIETTSVWKYQKVSDSTTWVSFGNEEEILCIMVALHPSHSRWSWTNLLKGSYRKAFGEGKVEDCPPKP